MTAPGTQPERTRLAWRRTVLTATVVALLAVRSALLADDPGVRMLGTALAMLLWLVMLVVGWRRITALTRHPTPRNGRQPAPRAPTAPAHPAPHPLSAAGPTALLTAATVIAFATLGLLTL
ncbi:MAG: DUF202 domain-containing protein [Micromonosporaceae bacterium]